MAEIVKHYFPSMVDLHNYSGAHSHSQKLYNWTTFNQKVLKKLGVNLTKQQMDEIINCVPDAVEYALKLL